MTKQIQAIRYYHVALALLLLLVWRIINDNDGGCLAPCCFIYRGMQTQWILYSSKATYCAAAPIQHSHNKSQRHEEELNGGWPLVARTVTRQWRTRGEQPAWRNARMNVLELHNAGGIPSRWPTACFSMLRQPHDDVLEADQLGKHSVLRGTFVGKTTYGQRFEGKKNTRRPTYQDSSNTSANKMAYNAKGYSKLPC